MTKDATDLEDPKDFLDRAEADPLFQRFRWQMRLSRLLAERGMVEIDLSFDNREQEWYFSLRWGTFHARHPKPLERPFRAAVCKTGLRVREGSFTLFPGTDPLTGCFVVERKFLKDAYPIKVGQRVFPGEPNFVSLVCAQDGTRVPAYS